MIGDDERALFAETVRHAYQDAGPVPADAALTKTGWHDALAEWGGPAIQVILGEQGRACGTSSAVDDVLAFALGLDYGHALAQPALGTTTAPGTVSTDGLAVAGIGTARLTEAASTVVVASDSDDVWRAVVVPTEQVTATPLGGIDPDAGLLMVEAATIPSSAWADSPAVDWPAARAVLQTALACELVGLSRGMLALAREHAMSRIQFGRPVASFQAVRHRLVEAYLAIEAAEAATTACVDVLGTGAHDGLPAAHAAMAKALAGSAARTAARHCQQVLAGIGFTAEHPFHRYFRRALLLDDLAGSARTLTREIGSSAVDSRQVPWTLPL